MATKTYLQLVNEVLVRLRETQVGSVSESAYSSLIGAWVNDAKRMVEDSWDWQALLTGSTVSILASTRDYTIPTLNERSRLVRNVNYPNLPLAFDTTPGDTFQLQDYPFDWVLEQRYLQNTPNNQAKPIQFACNRSSTGGVNISLIETPTGSRTWTLFFIDPQDDLSGDSDTLIVPYAPVVQIALDYALNERGEEIGEPGTTVQQKAMTHIANAVAIDAKEQVSKVTFYPN